MLDVAACIVTYRSDLEQLRQSVESFQKQGVDSELLLVDNSSGGEYLSRLRGISGAVVVESGANKGFGFGHNIGIKNAKPHRYYLVQNPDVVLHDGCLQKMISYMDEHPEIGLLLPKVLNVDTTIQHLNKRLPSVFDFFVRRFIPKTLQNVKWIKRRAERYIMLDVGYDKPCEVEFSSGCFMLFRADTLKNVGGFDEQFFMYLEDCDIGRRVAAAGKKVMFIPDAVITHHWARGSHKSLRLMWVMVRSMWYYYNKWGWKWL